MSINKKSNDATEKKGMALSDDALANVTGGKTYYAYEYWSMPTNGSGLDRKVAVTADRNYAVRNARLGGHALVVFDYDGDEQGARDYYNTMKYSKAFKRQIFTPKSLLGM